MAEDKKGFLLYADMIHVVKKLVLKDRENGTNYAGELFLHVLEYVNDLNPIPIDFIVEMAFEPIKQQLKRDLKKYEVRAERSRNNGQKGGRPKKPSETQKTQRVILEPRKPDKDNVTVNDNDTVNVKEISLKEKQKSIEERKQSFLLSMQDFKNSFPREMLNEFFAYWTEHGINDKKMRFEKEKTFGLSRRLATWQKRDKQFNQNKPNDGRTITDVLKDW